MSDLPKNLWHQNWNQEDWDRYCAFRKALMIVFGFGLALVVAAVAASHIHL